MISFKTEKSQTKRLTFSSLVGMVVKLIYD